MTGAACSIVRLKLRVCSHLREAISNGMTRDLSAAGNHASAWLDFNRSWCLQSADVVAPDTSAPAAVTAAAMIKVAGVRLAALEVGSHFRFCNRPRSASRLSMFANHLVTIAPHASVLVSSPTHRSGSKSSPTAGAAPRHKKHRTKSARDAPAPDKRGQAGVRIASRQSC
jgi:hypothetical protein